MSRISLSVSLLMLILFSCEEGYLTDCEECHVGIGKVTLKIRVANTDFIPLNTIVTLYEGAIEDNIIIGKYTIEYTNSFLIEDVIRYKDYTATMEFSYNGQQYITTAAECPKVRYDEDTCDEPCYYIYDNILDLRLRYD